MAVCFNCKNNRRQLLKLNCKHDTCIRCAADNYFLNCKNKINQKNTPQNSYYCENCLQQTPLDSKTLEELKRYFMENIVIQEKHKESRKEKIKQKENTQKERLERLQRLEVEGTPRPKSLEVEIEQRKRTLSKYLSDKQVEKFIKMQKQYGVNKNEKQEKEAKDMGTTLRQRTNPQLHTLPIAPNNEYELKSTRNYEAPKKRDNANMLKQKYYETDSFDKFGEHSQVKNEYVKIKEYQNRKLKTQHADHSHKMKRQQQEGYELYHNGKAVPNYNPKTANRILEQGKITENRQKSRYSSNSSLRAVGKIKSRKKNPSERVENVQPESPVLGREQIEYLQKLAGEHRNERLISAKSEDQRDPRLSHQGNPTKALSVQYSYKNNSNSMDWEAESKVTRKPIHEKTVAMAQRNSETMEQILQTLEVSEAKKDSVLSAKSKEKSLLQTNREKEKASSRDQNERLKVQTYFCKIHDDQEIIYFCLKCSQLICSECALHGSHKQHEIHSLKKSAQLLKQNLVHNMSTLNKMLIEEETKEKILKECINELSLECSRQKQQIKSSFENFIFTVDKKYKDLLKEIDDRFASCLNEYSEKLNESRNAYVQISQIKDDLSQTLQQCGTEEGGEVVNSQNSMAPAYNQFGNFHIKKHKNKQVYNQLGIQYINKLITRITQLSEFLKSAKETFLSPKKGSLISEPSSLKLSESSNLLEEKAEFDFFTTPATNTPQRSVHETPKRRSKRIVVGNYGLTVKNRIKLCKCQSIVESLVEMQQIMRAFKLDAIEYQVRALS